MSDASSTFVRTRSAFAGGPPIAQLAQSGSPFGNDAFSAMRHSVSDEGLFVAGVLALLASPEDGGDWIPPEGAVACVDDAPQPPIAETNVS